MNLILGHPLCQTCEHRKLAHRLGLGVCDEPGCSCTLYLSGQYEPDKPRPKLMGRSGSAKRERIKKTTKSGDTVQVPIETLLCIRCKHYQAVHEVAETSDSEGGRCQGFGCECWEFTTNPADENNFDRLSCVDLEQIEPEMVSPVTEPVNPHCIEQVDMVNHPPHYRNHPSGVECITVVEHMNFCIGNAVKYLWRADLKGGLEDLEKALWYVQREIERRKSASA